MQLEVSTLEDGTKLVKLIGKMDIKGTSQIEDSFTVQTASKKAGVIVDLSQVGFVASYGMRILVSNAKSLAGRGGKMVLFKPTPMVKNVLSSAGIDQLIPVYDELEAAQTALQAAIAD